VSLECACFGSDDWLFFAFVVVEATKGPARIDKLDNGRKLYRFRRDPGSQIPLSLDLFRPTVRFAHSPSTFRRARVWILFARVRRSISRACWQTIEAPRLRPSLGLHSNGFMKANKVPRERNPFLLTGKRRWRPFRWIFRRTRRDDAPNNLLSQDVKPV
jgi:hypothetical protein